MAGFTGANQFYMTGRPPTMNTLGDVFQEPKDDDPKLQGAQMKIGKLPSSTGPNWAVQKATAWDPAPGPLSAGDRYHEPAKMAIAEEKERRKKQPETPWKGTSTSKHPKTDLTPRNDHVTEYETERRGVNRDKEKYETEGKKNFLIKPAVKGGPGNYGTTMGKDGEVKYHTDPYSRKKEAEKKLIEKHKALMGEREPFKSIKAPPLFGDNKIYQPVPTFKKKEKKKPPPPKERPPFNGAGCKPNLFNKKFDYVEDPVDIQEKKERDERNALRREQVWKPLNTTTPNLPFGRVGVGPK